MSHKTLLFPLGPLTIRTSYSDPVYGVTCTYKPPHQNQGSKRLQGPQVAVAVQFCLGVAKREIEIGSHSAAPHSCRGPPRPLGSPHPHTL